MFADRRLPKHEHSLAEFFRDRLQACAEHFQPAPHEDTCWYLSALLARFGHSDALFSYDQGSVSLRPLALLYHDARQTPNHNERCLLLRQLGDLALFIGALFPASYEKRGIRKDYFVGMGGGAYDYLADHAVNKRHIYSELAQRFARTLEWIAHACAREHVFDASDVLALYQHWITTGDLRAEQQLRSLGITLQGKDSTQ